ncbi:MAG: AtpZ/AtpI family protein [Nitrospinota bacterium]|nr:AtpZ/AtpI family protein [Nitrospinota bacterium]
MGKRSGQYVEFTLLAMVGTQLVVSIFIGFGIGYWLDTKLGTKPLLMLLFGILGVAAGFLNIYRTVKKSVDDE